jgi:hypothetical protein
LLKCMYNRTTTCYAKEIVCTEPELRLHTTDITNSQDTNQLV